MTTLTERPAPHGRHDGCIHNAKFYTCHIGPPPLIVGVATPDTNTTTPQLLSCIAMITARAHHTAAAPIRNPPAPATAVTSPMIT